MPTTIAVFRVFRICLCAYTTRQKVWMYPFHRRQRMVQLPSHFKSLLAIQLQFHRPPLVAHPQANIPYRPSRRYNDPLFFLKPPDVRSNRPHAAIRKQSQVLLRQQHPLLLGLNRHPHDLSR